VDEKNGKLSEERHQQVIIQLDGDIRLSIIQGRYSYGKREFGTIEFWDYQAEEPTGWAKGEELYEFLKNFYEPTTKKG